LYEWVEGHDLSPQAWKGQSKITIPANSTTAILIDFDRLTMGYPVLTVDGGRNSKIQVKYAEALYEKVNLKAHRDSVQGKTMFGVWDVFRPDGEWRTYRPLWKRTFRYVQFNIYTKDEPLDCAAKLYDLLGMDVRAKHWEDISKGIKVSIRVSCWDEEQQLFRDYPDKEIYSQHTNLFAILCDVIPEPEQESLMSRILTFDHFDEVAISYFSFFLFEALAKTGMEDEFLHHLDFWHKFLERGHTTYGETGFASHDRSDCHAWSAHPAYYYS